MSFLAYEDEKTAKKVFSELLEDTHVLSELGFTSSDVNERKDARKSNYAELYVAQNGIPETCLMAG
ncbi:hypothetical protein COV93_07325 [Candidatus Woesearchaeota archaeon CG11_big_fil_rev_8_21_14_0_20_43_8]|nr:MAG: hypothetical protein COV93_07325 [Candidatus Woesearchaeota archaeon CG11_big_fil_rev_8_21_14_0_20_43_8]PIO08836.1 MAG: hypothetical protein COT47_01020 [Candidatus Woesearchaeota archaeon CG08_land_8_20_14_0_20_43_7]